VLAGVESIGYGRLVEHSSEPPEQISER
jgi:hypothetical protein